MFKTHAIMVMSDKVMRDGISLEEMERKLKEIPMQLKKGGLRMVAANGTEIKNLGQKTIRFRQSEQKKRVTFARQS